MSVFAAVVRRSFVVYAMLLLAACGGGGGGGGGGGSSGTLSLSTSVLTFNAPTTSTTTPAQVVSATVTGVSSGTLYIKIVSTGPAVASISSVRITGPTTGQATVFPASANSLGLGSFSSTITVTACTTDPNCSSGQLIGAPQTINVTYTVTGTATSVSRLDYTRGNTPVAGDANRQFTITAYPNQDWNTVTNVPWLSVLPASGNGANPVLVTASLVQAQVDALANGTYTGSITVTPVSGSPIVLPVTLTLARTQVSYVAPYVATSGAAAEVIIRGENFGLVTIQDVRFGSTSATTFSVISATEVRATHPALTAGSYPVQLQNNQNANWSLANLVVVDPPAYLATTLAYPDSSSKTVTAIRYDAERRALVVALADGSSSANNKFLRYVSSSGVWGAPVSTSLINLNDVALSTDGRFWLATSTGSAAGGITQFDATNLSIGITTNDTINGIYAYLVNRLSVANDGTAVVASAFSPACGNMIRYRIRNPQVTAMGGNSNTCSPPEVGGSADGSIIIAGTSIAGDVYAFNASTGVLSVTGIPLALTAAPVLNRSGSRMVLNKTRVYDAGFNYLGGLPATTLAVSLKPDGSIGYTYDSSGTVRKFDLTGTLVAGLYPEIGTGTTLAGNPGTAPIMTISADGGALFIAGGSLIVVQPTP